MTREAPKILLVDDDRGLLELVSMRLSASGYAVTTAESGEAALAHLRLSPPDVVVTDLRMDGMDGMALFEAIHRDTPELPVVILTAHGTIPAAVAATQRGVFGFLTKPFDSSALLETVADAVRLSSMPADGARADWRADVITRSPDMEALLARAHRAAASDASVCIYGPTGAGKALLARALHRASRRAQAPFVVVECGANPEGLLEAELFGQAKGASAGAGQDRRGQFEAAEGGTLYLNEVETIPLALQAKLLRALDERAVRAVGSNRVVAINVRIVCATQCNLEERVAAGEFREDLYYRLNVVKLAVPALAARREDIPLLATDFLARFAERSGRQRTAFAPDAMEALITAPWPGNVRQLLNVVEQVETLATAPVIPASLVRQAVDATDSVLTPLDEARKAFERDYLVRILKITSGNVTRAARLAGRNRTEFYRLLERHALAPAMFKNRPGAHRDPR